MRRNILDTADIRIKKSIAAMKNSLSGENFGNGLEKPGKNRMSGNCSLCIPKFYGSYERSEDYYVFLSRT